MKSIGFANLSDLVGLYMTGNNFSGSIPPQLFHLPLLQYLYLDDNSLSGKALAEIGNLSSLRALSLSGNRFSAMLVTPQDPLQGRDGHFTPQTRRLKV